MKRYLLDTSLLTAYLLSRAGAIRLISPWVMNREVATSLVCYGEAVEYLQGRADSVQRIKEFRNLLIEIRPYTLTYTALERYAAIRRALRGTGNMIGDIDTLIAATALARNLTLVTIDRDFQRVPHLSLMLISRERLR